MVTYSIKSKEAKDEITDALNMAEEATMQDLLMDLLHSATNAHILHLQTKSYSEHKALQKFYEEMPDLVDAVIESIQGSTGKIITGYDLDNDDFEESMTPLDYIGWLQESFCERRILLGDATEVQNLADNIAQLIDSTMYKLRFLK